MSRRFLCAITIAATTFGCVSQTMEREFDYLDQSIENRTGYDLAWISVTHPAGPVAERVAELLEDDLTADEAVQVALLNNRELQASFAELGVDIGQYVQAALIPNPVVDAEVRFRKGDEVIEGVVVQDFLEIFLIPLRRELQGAQLRSTQYRVMADVIDLAAETRMCYWDFVAERQHLALAQDVLDAASAANDMARRLRAAGNITLLALSEIRARYERTKLDVAEAEMQVIEARERLNALMGLWGDGTQWRTDDRLPPIPDEELELENIEDRAVAASVDLPAALYGIEVLARRLGIRRVTAIVPELKGGYAFERSPETETTLVKREFGNEKEYRLKQEDAGDVWWSGGVMSLELPIFDQNQGNRASARMAVRQRWELYTDLAIDIRTAARLAVYRLEYNRSRARFLEEVMVPVQHDITLRTHLQYNAMFLGIFQLLEQKQAELNTSRDYVETLRRYWKARTQTEQLLMGRIYDVGAAHIGNAGMGGMNLGIRTGLGDAPGAGGGGGH